ncbi:MAG TPA: PqqD family protein [Anaerolineales bacterium]|nr:PqqD family protein [Anaerolineales bacterium]
MLTLDTVLRIPEYVMFTTIEQDVVLLNASTGNYYSLNQVGARFWHLLSEGKTLREIHRVLLVEFEVVSSQLKQDLLELVGQFQESGLVDVAKI